MVLHGHACRDGNPGNFRTYKLCRHVTAQHVSFPGYRYLSLDHGLEVHLLVSNSMLPFLYFEHLTFKF